MDAQDEVVVVGVFFWGHGTLLVNVYVPYRCYMEMHGKACMTHYEFCKAIVLAKICLEEYGAPSSGS